MIMVKQKKRLIKSLFIDGVSSRLPMEMSNFACIDVLLALPGFFGMLNLSIREWVLVQTYGGILLVSNDEFLFKDSRNRSLPKQISTILSPTRKFLILSLVSYS